MVEILLDVCPGFEPEYGEFLGEWQDEEESVNENGEFELPYYLLMADLARYLIRRFDNKAYDEIGRVFGAIEHLLQHGDAKASGVIGIGLLEDLQNSGLYDASNSRAQPEDFRVFMRPETECFWNELYCFWDGRLPDGAGKEPREH